MPGKSNTFSKKNVAIPSAAPKERITVPIRTSGATTARSSAQRIRNTTHERDRHDQPVVARRRLAQVVLLRRRPADEDVVAAGAVRRLPDARDQVEARGAERVLVEGRLELGPGRALLVLAG